MPLSSWFCYMEVLVHGSAEATEHLKMHCAKNSDLHVYAPQIEETIDLTSDLCAYKVQLSEKFLSNVISMKVGEHEIAWVDAEVGKVDEKLTVLPPSSTPSAHKSVLVGDLKLADFKQFLANIGLQVEFAGGALRCGEYITVRKVGDSNQKVLVHGSAEATEHFKMHCAKNSDLHVYAPQIEETIDVTSDLCAYKVQLSEKFMSNVISKKVGEHEIAWVDAEVGKVAEKLTVLPPSSTPSAHKSVLVGDLKLADFKQFLANKGLQVEFAGGALRCGEYITVRKVGDSNQKGSTSYQQIVIEGPLCLDYYKIRELLYSQFFLL